MKQVKFAKRWRDRRNDTTVEEYPAGWSGEISDERATRAVAAKVLDGDPIDAQPPEPKAGAGETKTKA